MSRVIASSRPEETYDSVRPIAKFEKPPHLLALITKRTGAAKSRPLRDVIEHAGYATRPDPGELTEEFEKLIRDARKLLGIS